MGIRRLSVPVRVVVRRDGCPRRTCAQVRGQDVGARACAAPGGATPGPHPGHPTAEEGCRPASRGFLLALVTYGHDRTPSRRTENAVSGCENRWPRCGGRYSRRMLPLTVDPASPTAPFEQVRTQVAALVAQGDLAPGTRLPTVRQLAADLGLAANTVARAYRELEADGVLATYGRKGTFVRSAVVDAGHRTPPPGAARPGTAARPAAEAYVASVRSARAGRHRGDAAGRAGLGPQLTREADSSRGARGARASAAASRRGGPSCPRAPTTPRRRRPGPRPARRPGRPAPAPRAWRSRR